MPLVLDTVLFKGVPSLFRLRIIEQLNAGRAVERKRGLEPTEDNEGNNPRDNDLPSVVGAESG
jgi:hypothetical protein